MNKILMVAAEFPPCLSAGVQRTYHFAENLFKQGWEPYILSAHNRIYRSIDVNVKVNPKIEANIHRSFALDVSRHLAIKGKYFGFLESPDRFASWYYQGWRDGLKLVRDHKIDVIWSTYPISTAHRIADKIAQKSGVPWIADFRDPMHGHVDSQYPVRKKTTNVDRATVENADALVFATEKMKQLYIKAYPEVAVEKFHVIENGFDEQIFQGITRTRESGSVYTLLYSGALYPQGRDPAPVFEALSELKKRGTICSDNFQLVFRGAGDGGNYSSLIGKLDVEDLVSFRASISFAESIQEMKNADGLLVLQGALFDNQIPGKVYEYIATGNPIVALTGPSGATSGLLNEVQNCFVAEEYCIPEIVECIESAIEHSGGEREGGEVYSRRARSSQLLELLASIK